MSAEAVGAQMPTQVTLDDLASMAAADENHRYELSPEAVLSVVPPADPEHALLVSRIFAWLLTNGYGPDHPRYWIVERDGVTAVHRYVLDRDTGAYQPDPDGVQPLAWLLTTAPEIR